MVMTGNLSPVKPDDHVHVVTGLDDRADARHLVHLDRDADAGRPGTARFSTEPLPPASVAGGDLRAGRDRLACDLADDLRDVLEGAGVARGDLERLRLHLVGADDRSRAGCRPWRSRSAAPSWVRPGRGRAGAALTQQQDADEGHDGQKDPDEQDQTIRALQVVSPRDGVTGGTTVAPPKRGATIPKA